jgi:hypothetical protein
MFRNQHRCLPFCGIMFGLGQGGDVARGVAQRDQRLAVGQRDRVGEALGPCYQGTMLRADRELLNAL